MKKSKTVRPVPIYSQDYIRKFIKKNDLTMKRESTIESIGVIFIKI